MLTPLVAPTRTLTPTRTILSVLAVLLLFPACAEEDQTLVVYSGRSKDLVEPLLTRFTEQTGIQVVTKFGGSAELAAALAEEGTASSADVFWAQDAGALGAVQLAGLLETLPDSLAAKVDATLTNEEQTWIATSGRARTLAFSPERTADEVRPTSVFDLTERQFFGRVGWAPANGSFQAFVTAMRTLAGEEQTRNWLIALKKNGAKSYPKNSVIIQAIANGEIDYGLPNHYYLYRSVAENSDFPVAQMFFNTGDPGNLVNVAGAGVLGSSSRKTAAFKFLSFLLSDATQQYFADETFEYPVTVVEMSESQQSEWDALNDLKPGVDLDALRDLDQTLQLLREVELL